MGKRTLRRLEFRCARPGLRQALQVNFPTELILALPATRELHDDAMSWREMEF